MKIKFKTEGMKRLSESGRELKKKYGQSRSKKIQRRLEMLVAADCLDEVPHTPPERRHQLEGKRDGEFAVDVEDQWRIVFQPDQDPIPRKEDGGIDIRKVISILILNICEDYHK